MLNWKQYASYLLPVPVKNFVTPSIVHTADLLAKNLEDVAQFCNNASDTGFLVAHSPPYLAITPTDSGNILCLFIS
jgi:hypothetical protein